MEKSFADEAFIIVQGGKGGNGSSSFRREKFIEFGGPDGGDGGKGGDVCFRASSDIHTLLDIKNRKNFLAQPGMAGGRRRCTGISGKDLYIKVPIGTEIYDEDGYMLCDLNEEGMIYIASEGGKGGLGNVHFKSSINRAPRRTTKGLQPEKKKFKLNLKVLSDVGIVGFPNAGKSTFLSSVSQAKPKIADYMFTTLKPELGVITYNYDTFTMADIPGLLEGASEGFGLGHRFMRHLERCKILLHLIDINSDDCVKSYQTVRQELEQYNSGDMIYKKEIVALSKCDLCDEDEISNKLKMISEYTKKTVYLIDIFDNNSLNNLIEVLYKTNKELT